MHAGRDICITCMTELPLGRHHPCISGVFASSCFICCAVTSASEAQMSDTTLATDDP